MSHFDCVVYYLGDPDGTSQSGQGTEGEAARRDLRAELLQAEAAHFAKKNGVPVPETSAESTSKRQLEGTPANGGDGELEEDPEAKRRRILEETREIDADSEGSEEESSEEERLVAWCQCSVAS